MRAQDNGGSAKEPITFAKLAFALANDYTRIFIISPEDDSYEDYTASGPDKSLVKASSGDNFFVDIHHDVHEQVWYEDQERFLQTFRKERVMEALRDGKSFSLTYRLVIDGEPRYYSLKTIRSSDQSIIIGVQDVDEQMRQKQKEDAERLTYSEVADSLSSLFEVIYLVDTKTDRFHEYSASETFTDLGLCMEGENFFERIQEDIQKVIHPDDVEKLLYELERDRLLSNLRHTGMVTLNYRQNLDNRIQHVRMIAFYSKTDPSHVLIGVRNIDEQIRNEERIAKENRMFGEIARALARRYEVIYRVNIETNEYTEYSASSDYARLEIGAKGVDFFAETQENMKRDIFPEDLPMMAMAMQKNYLLESLRETGKNFLNYRLMIGGRPQYVTLFAVRPKEDSKHINVAVANVAAAKRMELDFEAAIGSAMDMANRDALTGVKNKRAYAQTEMTVDDQITSREIREFAVVVCDINGLKEVNDTKGHKAGDDFICSACSMICETFKHSPVFRIGGDEFVAYLKGSDYEHRSGILSMLKELQAAHRAEGKVTIAVGMSEFLPESDLRMQDVFERADSAMYYNKRLFKQEGAR